MEYQNSEDDTQAIRTYFEDLAETNAANMDINSFKYDIVPKSQLSAQQCDGCILMQGSQTIAKFKDTAANTVQINMALLRLSKYQTDILLTFNNPLHISERSSSHAAEPSNSQTAWTQEDFNTIVRTLRIIDEGLFG